MKTLLSTNRFLCAALLAMGLFSLTAAPAQPAVESWVRGYNGLTESDDRAQEIVLNSWGNLIVAGSSDAGVHGRDWLILSYSRAGAVLWTNGYAGPENSVDMVNAVTADRSGNVIVTGYSGGIEGGSDDYVTIKYSGAGIPLWTNRYTATRTPAGDSTNAVAVHANGDVFVTGGAAILAYSSAGVPLWTNLYPSIQATGVAVDGNGNVFVTGRAGNYDDCVTVKYSHSGVPVWTNRYTLCGYGRGFSVALDGSGNVVVAASTDCSGLATLGYSSGGELLWANHYGELGHLDQGPAAKALALDETGNVFVAGCNGTDLAVVAYSNAGLPLWAHRYQGPGNGKDCGTAVATDGAGNVIVAGASVGNGGHYDYVTIKYSAAGVPLWTHRHPGVGDSQAAAVAVDMSGNVFVTGSSWNGSSYDYVTLAYSGVGAPLWTNRVDRLAETDDQGRAVAVDGSGNVFVTGSLSGSGVSDYITFAYSGSGASLWTNRYTAPGNSIDFPSAVAVDGSGNVIVTGKSGLKSNRDPWDSFDYATIKYSITGTPIWTNRYDGPRHHNDEASALAVDASGNVIVTGGSMGSDGGHAFATIKYSSAGVALWTNRYNASASQESRAIALAVDKSGNVIVTGESSLDTSSQDYLTIKYSGAGAPMWTNRYNGPRNSSDFVRFVAVDGTGTVFVTGYSHGIGASWDCATLAYSSAGVPLWTNRYDGGTGGNDVVQALVVDGSGNVIIAGSTSGGGSSGDYLTIKYSGAGVPLWTNRYNGPANGWDGASAIAADVDGSIVVTGSSTSTNGWPDSDFATIKYSSTGVPLWTNRYSGPAYVSVQPYALAVDGSGNVLVTGQSWNDTSYDCVTIKYSSAGVPLLTIALMPVNKLALSWPSPSLGFALQQNTSGIASLNWSNVVTTPSDNGTTKTVILNPPAENAIFRLIHP